jgi:hypothetical protein
MAAQVKRHSETPYLDTYDRQSLLAGIREKTESPIVCVRYSLSHVELSPSGKEARLHVFFWAEDGSIYEYRLWIVRADRGWRLYDWEHVPFGMRKSADWALSFAHEGEHGLEEVYAAFDDIAAADARLAEWDHDQAEASLRQAAGRRVLPEYKNFVALSIAYTWSRAGRSHEFLEACRKVSEPRDVPGALYGQALAWQQLGQHQRSLEMAQRYETAIGGGPLAAELQATSLTALRRFDEAAAQWQKLLAHDRENTTALLALAGVLSDDQTDVLRQRVLRCSSPADTAVTLAESLVYRENSPTLSAMLAVVAELEPQSPRHLGLQAMIASHEGRTEQAAALYLEAYGRDDEEQRERWHNEFVDVFISAGQWEEAYRRAPDSAAAFEQLAGAYSSGDYDFPRPVFARIVAAHRAAHPDDPWGAYYQADLLIDDEQHDEAIDLLRGALAKRNEAGSADDGGDGEDSYLDGALNDRLADALIAIGRHLEAYRSYEPRDEAFSAIADRCRWREQPAALREVIAEHRRAQPSDPWLVFYEALLQMLDKRHDLAEALLARCGTTADDEALRSRSRSERISNAIAAGNLLALYEQLDDPEGDLQEIAALLRGRENWGDLSRLIDAAGKRGVSEEALAAQELELYWARGDYQGIADRFFPEGLPRGALRADWRGEGLRDKLLRSLLRLGRLDDAEALAQRWERELGKTLPLLLVAVKRGDAEQIAQRLEDYVATEGAARLDRLYLDEDVGDILLREDFRQLRLKHPPGVFYPAMAGQIVLLLRAAPALDEAALRELLSRGLQADAELEQLPRDLGATAVRSFVLRSGGRRVLIAWQSAAYMTRETTTEYKFEDHSLRDALQSHAAWLEVAGIDAGNKDAASALARSVASLLLPECKPLAVSVSSPGRLLPADRAADLLADDDFAAAAADAGEAAWLYFEAAEADPAYDWAERARRRLREFQQAFQERREGQTFLLRTDRQFSATREELWVVVDRIERDAGGDKSYVGTFRDGSHVDPRIKAGEPVRLNRYNVSDWRIVEGEQVIQGSDEEAAK